MKKFLLGIVFFCFAFQFSCTGDFEPDAFAINLKYPGPDSNCEEGEPSGNLLKLPFRWQPQGDLSEFILTLNGEAIPVVDPIEVEGTFRFDYEINYDQDYEWFVQSGTFKSELRTFRTPIAGENNNNVPFAVKFDTPTFNGNTDSMDVTFTWNGGDADNDGNLKYDAFWSPEETVGISNNSGEATDLTSATVTFTILNFNPNQDYYILVIAKDGESSASSILRFRQL